MNLDLFSVPFFIGNIDLKRIKLEAKIGKAFTSRTPSSFSEKNFIDPESKNYLMSVIAELLGEKYKYFGITLIELWRNKYLDNDFQEPHIHVNSKFSFIIFEEVGGDTPHTIFYNPAKYLISSTLGYGQDCVLKQFRPQMKSGQIIVFPSYVEHMVNRNSDQVTISGNIDFTHTELQQHENEEIWAKKDNGMKAAVHNGDTC